MDLSIIIVNWNSAAYVRKCLASIYANTKNLAFEVFIIDNASFDECGEIVKAEFPQVKFIQSQDNLGFARANNLGFSRSQGRDLLFLNPDAEILGRAVNILLSALDSIPDAGIVGPKLLNSDGSIQTSCIKAFPSILNQALDADYLQRIFPKWRLWGMRPLFEPLGKPAPVDVVSGACLMIKRDVFEKIGQFTADYFMYSEDVDLCYKVKQAGGKTCYVGQANVIHHGGRSSAFQPDNNFANIAMRESQLKFMKSRHGRGYAAAFQMTVALMAVSRVLLLCGVLVLTFGQFRRRSLSTALQKWVMILRWAVGAERVFGSGTPGAPPRESLTDL